MKNRNAKDFQTNDVRDEPGVMYIEGFGITVYITITENVFTTDQPKVSNMREHL